MYIEKDMDRVEELLEVFYNGDSKMQHQSLIERVREKKLTEAMVSVIFAIVQLEVSRSECTHTSIPASGAASNITYSHGALVFPKSGYQIKCLHLKKNLNNAHGPHSKNSLLLAQPFKGAKY